MTVHQSWFIFSKMAVITRRLFNVVIVVVIIVVVVYVVAFLAAYPVIISVFI